ncbi:MAG: hypothetical protein PT116_13340 [Aphanizomenon gracile PMC638.10]|nr:hypothetical protein [Aphanizomenon gracile PMC638.10]
MLLQTVPFTDPSDRLGFPQEFSRGDRLGFPQELGALNFPQEFSKGDRSSQ